MSRLADALGPVGVWGHLDSLGIAQVRDYARRVEELGYGALWVPEVVGREPFALLAVLATETEGLVLGTSIASVYSRDAVSMRTAAMTLHEATGGRFVLGLGVSHPHLVSKVRGHEYERPVGAMRAALSGYRAAPWRGPLPPDPPWDEPPMVIAALRERMAELGATEADGVFPYHVTAERVAWMRSVVDRATDVVGRPRTLLCVTLPVVLDPDPGSARAVARGYLTPYLRAPNYRASWEQQGFTDADWESPGSDRLVDGMVAWGAVPDLVRRLQAHRHAGADHVALIPLGPEGSTEHLPTIETLAEVAAAV